MWNACCDLLSLHLRTLPYVDDSSLHLPNVTCLFLSLFNLSTLLTSIFFLQTNFLSSKYHARPSSFIDANRNITIMFVNKMSSPALVLVLFWSSGYHSNANSKETPNFISMLIITCWYLSYSSYVELWHSTPLIITYGMLTIVLCSFDVAVIFIFLFQNYFQNFLLALKTENSDFVIF